VFNLKCLNFFVHAPHFKLEDNRRVRALIQRGDWLVRLDLKSAYYLIAVEEDSRKYLRFRFQGSLYEFKCLPFGLNLAPYLFTKLLKPVLAFFRASGIRLVFF